MKNEILQYLKEDVRFRERANKNKGIANLIMRKYGIDIPKDKRDDIVADILNADRNWRDILLNEVSLRGNDYNSKLELEAKKREELGYTVGFTQQIKV